MQTMQTFMAYRFERDQKRRERRRVLYNHVLTSQKTMASLQPYFSRSIETLRRVGTGETATPNRGTDIEMAQYLKITDKSLEEYLSGEIDLQELLDRGGEYKLVLSKQITVDTVVQDALTLPLNKRLEVLSRIAQSVQAREAVENAPPPPPTIPLTADERDRLKKIFALSLSVDERDPEDLSNEGVCPELIEYLESTPVEVEFTEKDYIPLLPFLYRVTKWVAKKSGLTPMLNLESSYKDDLDGLLREIRSAGSESSEGCDIPQQQTKAS